MNIETAVSELPRYSPAISRDDRTQIEIIEHPTGDYFLVSDVLKLAELWGKERGELEEQLKRCQHEFPHKEIVTLMTKCDTLTAELASAKADTARLKVKIEAVVSTLTKSEYNTRRSVMTCAEASERALHFLEDVGLIEHCGHPCGGDVWRVNGNLYGRTDGMTNQKFDDINAALASGEGKGGK